MLLLFMFSVVIFLFSFISTSQILSRKYYLESISETVVSGECSGF